jgi:hypothetical protein
MKHRKPARELSPRVEARLMRVATALAIVTVSLFLVAIVVFSTVGAS